MPQGAAERFGPQIQAYRGKKADYRCCGTGGSCKRRLCKKPRRSLKRPWAAMKKRFRLRKNSDFQRVRREGHSWAHPLLVLCALRNDLGYSRFGFSASKRVGGAVVRNHARRLMREATRLRQPMITDGWDVVIIARQPMREADFHQVDRAIGQLLRCARLLKATENLAKNRSRRTIVRCWTVV